MSNIFSMENLIIEKTPKTPFVNFDFKDAIFRIEGRSIPENPENFYIVIINWLNGYFENPKVNTEFHFQYEYINSGSSKFIMNLFQLIKNKHDSGANCVIHWYYEEDDENIYELGLHYQITFNFPFKLVEIIV